MRFRKRPSGIPISFDDMPDDNARLAAFQVELPRLNIDSVEFCPASISDLAEYVTREGESVSAADLHFERTAAIGDRHYWLWTFSGADQRSALRLSPRAGIKPVK